MNEYFWFSILVLVNAIILYVLTANVSRLRLKLRISIGDGGSKEMLYAIRAHSNGVEQVPIYALVILALTLLSTNPYILAGLVISFSIARVFHAYGMLGKNFIGRRIGAGLTYILQMVAILVLAVKTVA